LPDDQVAVLCEHVVRTYRSSTGEVRALRDVSAAFPRGQISAVVGPSGSGKSSLLRSIAGLDRPTSGAISVEGHEVVRGSIASGRRLRRELVGYLYQRPSDNFLPHLTVGEHVRSAIRGGRSTASLDAMQLLARLGLDHRADHLPKELSGGEQQRAAVAVVLAAGSRIVVADEPTAELDSASSRDVLDQLRRLAEEGITFILATHDPGVVAASHGTIELRHGSVNGHLATDHIDGGTWRRLRWPEPSGPRSLFEDRSVLRLRHVEKTYGSGVDEVIAVRGVDLEANAGELIGIMGRSGSGKTTLLHIAAGWEAADAGTVTAPGARTPDWSEVAVLPQRLGLMEELSARENIEYPVRIVGQLAERRDLIADLIEELGLTELQDRYPRETSLGEQQRIALARALVMGPELLIADEPTGHQDAGWVERMMRVCRDAADAGTACVIATHDPELMPHVDRAFLMTDGEISPS
jgi:ABC-type lipoprotein export system ATPase subunit